MIKYNKLLKEESIRYPQNKDNLPKEPATQDWMKMKLKLSYYPNFNTFKATVHKRFPETPIDEIETAWNMRDEMNEGKYPYHGVQVDPAAIQKAGLLQSEFAENNGIDPNEIKVNKLQRTFFFDDIDLAGRFVQYVQKQGHKAWKTD